MSETRARILESMLVAAVAYRTALARQETIGDRQELLRAFRESDRLRDEFWAIVAKAEKAP